MDLVSTVIDKAWVALFALVGVVYNRDRKEIERQRDNVAKLFDKLEEHSRRSEDRHVELLNTIHTGLAQKADK